MYELIGKNKVIFISHKIGRNPAIIIRQHNHDHNSREFFFTNPTVTAAISIHRWEDMSDHRSSLHCTGEQVQPLMKNHRVLLFHMAAGKSHSSDQQGVQDGSMPVVGLEGQLLP
jgi:hypothetical protein